MICPKLQWCGPSKQHVFDHTIRYAHTGFTDGLKVLHPSWSEDQLETCANRWLTQKLTLLTQEMAAKGPESESTGLLSCIYKNDYLKCESRGVMESLDLIRKGEGVRTPCPTS